MYIKTHPRLDISPLAFSIVVEMSHGILDQCMTVLNREKGTQKWMIHRCSQEKKYQMNPQSDILIYFEYFTNKKLADNDFEPRPNSTPSYFACRLPSLDRLTD